MKEICFHQTWVLPQYPLAVVKKALQRFAHKSLLITRQGSLELTWNSFPILNNSCFFGLIITRLWNKENRQPNLMYHHQVYFSIFQAKVFADDILTISSDFGHSMGKSLLFIIHLIWPL